MVVWVSSPSKQNMANSSTGMLQEKNTHESVVAENSHPPSGTQQNGNLRMLLLKNSQVTNSLSVVTLQNTDTGMLQQKNTQVSNSLSVVTLQNINTGMLKNSQVSNSLSVATLPEEHQEQWQC